MHANLKSGTLHSVCRTPVTLCMARAGGARGGACTAAAAAARRSAGAGAGADRDSEVGSAWAGWQLARSRLWC